MTGSHGSKEKLPDLHIVTGGGGYAGFRLGKALAQRGHRVVLFDVRPPTESLPEHVQFIQGDIRNEKDVTDAFKGADCVFHLASYGMSGREQLNRSLIEAVNIGGTDNVIKACVSLCIPRLVYTSTYNVVFGGQQIMNGNEEKNSDYFPPEKHPDYYSRTKSYADKKILSANGTQLSDGHVLSTCALRLAGVYGPGEQRHLPRIVGYIEAGLFSMVYGAKDSLVDFLHVDNLVQAHVKAGEKLKAHDSVVAGQAYFICDSKPVNNFEFFRPLVEGLGYTFPTMRLPVSLVYFIAFITEMMHFVIGRVYNFQPLLTRTEVYKTGVTHFFSTAKAKKHFGYVPTIQNDLTEVVQWFKDHGHGKEERAKVPHGGYTMKRFLSDLALVIIFVTVIFSILPSAK